MGSIAIRFPATVASVTTALVLTAFFWATGALFPSELPAFANSARQLTGMVLMLIVLPAYIVAAGFVMQQRSLEFVEQLRSESSDPRFPDAAAQAIRGGFATSWRWGCLAGIAMTPFNTQFVHAFTESATPAIDIGVSVGQLVIWLSVGLAGGVRVVTARAFSRLGERIDVDLFHIDRLKPLARSRMLDVVAIAGGMALTALQSLDTEVRWENYRFAVIVMIPVAALLLLWPLRSVHLRIREEKRRRLAHIETLIGETGTAGDPEAIERVEMLLAHRDRVRAQGTWPLDTALLSRFAFYVVVPPLAWVAAAFVENFVDRLAGG